MVERYGMQREETDRLGDLNAYQIAGLALVASTVAALGVVFLLRRSGILGGPALPPGFETQPAVPHNPEPGTPDHFTEELLVPGITFTGKEVAQQDAEVGRSPEGV
jgi:hypothetical protein